MPVSITGSVYANLTRKQNTRNVLECCVVLTLVTNLSQELLLRERGISSLDITRASKVGKIVGNMPEKGRGRKEGTDGGREERGIMSINDIVHLHLPSPIHFTSTQISCLLAVTIQPFMGRLIYAACTQ